MKPTTQITQHPGINDQRIADLLDNLVKIQRLHPNLSTGAGFWANEIIGLINPDQEPKIVNNPHFLAQLDEKGWLNKWLERTQRYVDENHTKPNNEAYLTKFLKGMNHTLFLTTAGFQAEYLDRSEEFTKS